MFYKTKKFKEEQSLWYKKIEESGFVDIEDGDNLKQSSSNAYKKRSGIERYAKREYYLALSGFMRDKATEFDNEIDYFVIAKISIGSSIAEVVRELVSLGHPKNRETIRYILRKYENRWGLKKWPQEKLKKNLRLK